jgi:hypothetical protein
VVGEVRKDSVCVGQHDRDKRDTAGTIADQLVQLVLGHKVAPLPVERLHITSTLHCWHDAPFELAHVSDV